MQKILVIEDDATINQVLYDFLTEQGFEVSQAFSGTEGKLLWQMQDFDLLIMDLMLPGLDGELLLAEIRQTSNVPIIVLSARDGLDDKVDLLSAGADDYMTKPFALEEVLVRIQVQLRKQDKLAPASKKNFGLWQIDPEARQLLVKQEPLNLTAHEFAILELLMSRPSKVFTKQEIYEAVWQEAYAFDDKTISVHISNIRQKLKASATEHYIETVWGIGFKMTDL